MTPQDLEQKIRESVWRFCRTQEAAENLVGVVKALIETYGDSCRFNELDMLDRFAAGKPRSYLSQRLHERLAELVGKENT